MESLNSPLAQLPLQLNPQELAAPVSLKIEWENGSETLCSLGDPALADLAAAGYHWLTIKTSERSQRIRWILAPDQCHFPNLKRPANGINCFLPSLRSERNWGAGDLSDLRDFAKRLAERAPVDFIALNPLHAIHNRTPYNTSPYLPLSIFTHNLLYLDIQAMPEFAQSEVAGKISQSAQFQQQLANLRASEFVEYEEVAKLKTFFLLLLYRQFIRGSRQELDHYRSSRGPWLENYCTYMAFDRYFHRRNPDAWHWHHWPEAYRSPHSSQTRALANQLARQIDFYAFIEMRLEEQISATHKHLLNSGYSLGLYHDLALATDRVGADYWAYQDLFAPRVRVGSPPDDFNENGQDWGFPALHPQRHADSGYEYFIESIRCAARHGGTIRLDHVMRLARLYWIPDQMSARDGAYVRDHFEDLLRILALESQRNKFIVVGEDLGTVPDYFRKALDQFRIFSYWLILFERNGDNFKPSVDYPRDAIASFTTHDLPTFDGWLTGMDLDSRLRTGMLPASELAPSQQARTHAVARLREAFLLGPEEANPQVFFAALCRFLSSTPSQLRLLNLEELSGEREQQNLPGTTSEAPNWRRRVSHPLETLFNEAGFRRRLEIYVDSISAEPRQ
ncbi:MAG: 4-alpha-glucanotransferase [Acidobacteria bacterium]|nr:4-alpha-glucanotransferase [Acidobacteriota bacterium]